MRVLHQHVGERLQLGARISSAVGFDGELKISHFVFL